MKITKRQLQRLIKEGVHKQLKNRHKRALREQGGWGVETGSDLMDFAKAYAGLGGAVQEQVDAIVAAYFNSGGSEDERFAEAVYEQNPNAIDMAYDKLGRVLGMMDGDDALGIQEALQAAMELVNEG
jgi:cytochrome oxidase Cu insertion factor (SCO1/SenC/PrrC family)